MGFNPNFECLVKEQYQQDNNDSPTTFILH
jgi:hypothetical protein